MKTHLILVLCIPALVFGSSLPERFEEETYDDPRINGNREDRSSYLDGNQEDIGEIAKRSESVVTVPSALMPLAVYPLTKSELARDLLGLKLNPDGIMSNVKFSTGPFGTLDGSFLFKGAANSYVKFPNGQLKKAEHSITLCAWFKNEGGAGPIFNFDEYGWGVHFWTDGPDSIFVRITKKPGNQFTEGIIVRNVKPKVWQFACTTYDSSSGKVKIFVNETFQAERSIGQNLLLATEKDVRMGARINDGRYFKGSISCMQVYGTALTAEQIKTYAKKRCYHEPLFGPEHKPYWCGSNREIIKYHVTKEQCKFLCLQKCGCKAIEWWEKYNFACFWCKAPDQKQHYPWLRDLSYAPHVIERTASSCGTK